MKIMIKKEQIDKIDELQKQVDELKEEWENMQAEIIDLESKKEDLYFQNQNLQSYIDNHEPIWKRNAEQAIKDTAKEICDLILEYWKVDDFVDCNWVIEVISEKYGVDMK